MSTAIIIGASVAAASLIGLLVIGWSGVPITRPTYNYNPATIKNETPQNPVDTLISATRTPTKTSTPTYNDQNFASFEANSNGSQEGGRRKSKSKRRKSRQRKTKKTI